MQKKIANFYPFPIRLGGWGKVFLFMIISLSSSTYLAQSIAHAYKKQPSERDRIYSNQFASGWGSISLVSKKIKDSSDLYNFNTPYVVASFNSIKYPIISKFKLNNKSLSLIYTDYRPVDSSTGYSNNPDNLLAIDRYGNFYQFKYQYFDNDKYRSDYHIEKYNSQFKILFF